MLVSNLNSAIFVPEGEIRNSWRKGNSSALCAQAKEPSEIKKQSQNLFITSHVNLPVWTVCCLLCTKTGRRPCTHKTNSAYHSSGCHEISNSNGEGAPLDTPNDLTRVFPVTGWFMELVCRIILLIILCFDEGGLGRLSGLGVVHRRVHVWVQRMERVRAGYVWKPLFEPCS